MRHFAALAGALCLLAAAAAPAAAQNPFATAVRVNERAVTYWEIDQRARLLEFFRTPGDLAALAREQLIDDRLRQILFDRSGITLSPESLQAALEEFAGRANLPLDQFLGVLAESGIDPQTLTDYLEVNVTWRDYIRARYGSRVTITEAEIDAVLAREATAASRIDVLLSEIILPAPPPRAAEAAAIARQIARMTSFAAFEAAAREYSALPSREAGGRIDWLPVGNLPAPLRPVILGLSPGEVTPPIPIENGIALFQLRAVRERGAPEPRHARIDYALLYLPGGLSPEARAEAARIEAVTDRCDDLYGIAAGQPPEVLDRRSEAPDDIPPDIALELARLDPGEVSAVLTRDEGRTLLLVMLCGRTPAGAEETDREAVRSRLRSERLAAIADALLADLRAAASIAGE